jgi:phage shock protein A
MKSVRDNGVPAVRALAERVGELTDHVDHEGVRTAILRQDLAEALAENAALHEGVAHLHNHIGALDGHVAGLEQAIEHLQQALTGSEQRYRALMATKSFRMMAPFRRLYGIVRRTGARSQGA